MNKKENWHTGETWLHIMNTEHCYEKLHQYIEKTIKQNNNPTYMGYIRFAGLNNAYIPYQNFKFNDSRIQRKVLTEYIREEKEEMLK